MKRLITNSILLILPFLLVNIGLAQEEPLPDLIVTSLAAPASASTRENIQVSWTVANQGNGTAIGGENYWVDLLYLSTDNVLDSQDTQLTSFWRWSQPLAAGASYTATANIQIPQVSSGNYYLLIKTDGWPINLEGGRVYESREWNNVFAQLVTIEIEGGLSEEFSQESNLTEELLSQKSTLSDVTVTGDLTGIANFPDFEILSINSGSFSGKGFSQGQWQATLEGISYQGNWQGVSYLIPSERKLYLKGTISGGEASGIVEGYLSESTPESGIYDQYSATWRLGFLGGQTVSVTLNLEGKLNYLQPTTYPSTNLYALQIAVNGTTLGHYTEPIDTVLTHLRVTSQDNPYYGQGFSIISYISQTGSGEGWTYDKVTAPGKLELKGLFTSPLLGIVSATLDETTSPKILSLSIERVDLGLPPAPDLKVKVWGPTRVSPGQTINYTIEYRNDGVKASEETLLFIALDDSVKYTSASPGAFYNDILNTVDWNLGSLPAKSSGYLSVKTEVAWGLPQGTSLETNAIINELIPHSEKKGIFVNGIGLYVTKDGIKQRNERYVQICSDFAKSRDLEWIEAYNTGSKLGDINEVKNALNGIATEHNGLKDVRVTGGFEYETAWGYSGGTMTLVTAISQRYFGLPGLKVKELVLISPVGITPLILEGLHSLGVEKITIYQSEKDKLPFADIFQLKISKDDPLRNQLWLEVKDRDYKHTLWLEELLNEDNKDKENMSSSTPATIAAARDPNYKLVSPEGDVSPGQRLTYRVEYENEGEGIAYGVYFTDTLEEDLDDSSLTIGPVLDTATGQQIGGPGIYNPQTRTIAWFVGEVGSRQGGSATFSVKVKDTTPDGSEAINFATVYFPSVPEATRTNGTVNRVTTVIDNIAPTTTASTSPSPNQAGWSNTDVTITLASIDNENGSGVKEIHYQLIGAEIRESTISSETTQVTISTEGSTTMTYYATDNIGNVEPVKSLEIKIDKTPSVITAQTSPEPNAFGWNNTDVTVSFTATDNLSGIASVTEPQTITAEGANQRIGGEAVDLAGNTASTYVNLSIDKTSPEVIIAAPEEQAEYILKQPVLSSWQATDSLSGIASIEATAPSGQALDTSSVGPKPFKVSSLDKASNQKSLSVTYKVIYTFSGILPPVESSGTSVFKLGSTIPVKFYLKDAQGNFITNAIGVLSIQKFSDNAPSGEPIEAVSTAAFTTGSLFRYDTTENQYIFNLSTKTLSTGLWQLKIELDDTEKYTVFVGLK